VRACQQEGQAHSPQGPEAGDLVHSPHSYGSVVRAAPLLHNNDVIQQRRHPGLPDISALIPKHITLEAYEKLLTGRFIPSIKVPNFPLWVLHSIELAAATALFSVALAMLAGYALSRLDMPAKKSLATFIYIITFLPTTATTVPLYLLFARFHLLNYAGLVLAYTPGTAVFAAFLAKLSIDAIPPDYEEAAMIDGLSRFGAFLRIVFRMALPVVALTALLGFLGAYMDYATAYAFIGSNSNAWTAMLGLWYLAASTTTPRPPPTTYSRRAPCLWEYRSWPCSWSPRG